MREAGVIGGIGAGFNSMGSIPRFLDLFDIDFFLLAMRYTLLEQDVLDSEFPRCAERGVGIVIGGGYNSGILATGAVPGAMYNYAPAGPEILERVAKIERVCARHRVPLPAAALQFPLGHPIVASIIPGAISRAQVEKNVAAFRHPIPRRPVGGAQAREADPRRRARPGLERVAFGGIVIARSHRVFGRTPVFRRAMATNDQDAPRSLDCFASLAMTATVRAKCNLL